MKELSIEEKAKAYDEAIKKAKIWQEHLYDVNDKDYADELNYIFPELKESEDERVRNKLIEFFKGYFPDEEWWGNITQEDIIAYLEKQGEPTEINPSEFDSQLNRLLGQFKSLPKEELASSLSFYLNVVQNDGTYKEEKQGEQKPVDKVDSKFKVGDWVVSPNGVYWHIDAIKNNRYEVSSTDGARADWPLNTNLYHLWTIQDVKDGDVLHSIGFHNDCIFIFNGLDNWIFDEPNGDRAVATGYCCLFVSADNMEFGIQGPDCVEVNTIKPATKIQRDLLFQKMHEVGYEWDAERKELRKIEQKPTEWSEEDREYMQSLLDIINGTSSLTPSEVECHKDWLKALKERVQPQPKQEWSEEDIRKIKLICTYLDAYKSYQTPVGTKYIDGCISWAKTLKERVGCKINCTTTKEWSEEDEKMLDGIIEASTHHCYLNITDIEWLKSLKDRVQPQFTWKPSDRQMNVLEYYMHTLACNEHKEILFGLYQDLKKLKE